MVESLRGAWLVTLVAIGAYPLAVDWVLWLTRERASWEVVALADLEVGVAGEVVWEGTRAECRRWVERAPHRMQDWLMVWEPHRR